MSFILIFSICLCFLIFPPKAHAIVVLPAIILVPLVKLIAFVVGVFSIPVGSGGLILAKLTKNYKAAILIAFIFIVLIAIITTIILRFFYPDNPWI